MKLIIMNEGIDFDVKGKEDAVEAIIEEYERHDVSMSEVLASVELKGFSMEDVVDIYAECMSRSDGDYVIRITDELTSEMRAIIESSILYGI